MRKMRVFSRSKKRFAVIQITVELNFFFIFKKKKFYSQDFLLDIQYIEIVHNVNLDVL